MHASAVATKCHKSLGHGVIVEQTALLWSFEIFSVLAVPPGVSFSAACDAFGARGACLAHGLSAGLRFTLGFVMKCRSPREIKRGRLRETSPAGQVLSLF